MNLYPTTMSDLEYTTLCNIAKKLDMDIEDLVSYLVCKPIILHKTTKEKKDEAVKTYYETVEMLAHFSDAMSAKNNQLLHFSDFQDKIYAAFDFIDFIENYDDDFRIKVQSELEKAIKIYGKRTIPGEILFGDVYYDELIYENLEYFHTWNEYDVFFLEDEPLSQFLHDRILYPAIDDKNTYDYTVEYAKCIKRILVKNFGKVNFEDSDSRELSEGDVLLLYDSFIPALFAYGAYVSSLVVSEE